MLRGLYTSASGMLGESYRTDQLANDLANVNTNGYKRDQAVFRTFPQMLLSRMGEQPTLSLPHGEIPVPMNRPQRIGSLGTGVQLERIYTNTQAGPLAQTGNTLDFAIAGDGYFVVQTPAGQRLTRDGAFQINAQGTLVTYDGFPVLGTQGPIQVQGKMVVEEDGTVLSDNQLVDRLLIVGATEITKQGNNLFTGNLAPAGEYRICQGFIEKSNVNSIRSMVELIEATRAYEANQKAIWAQDETLGKAIAEVGRVV